jgi:hypothetical protein
MKKRPVQYSLPGKLCKSVVAIGEFAYPAFSADFLYRLSMFGFGAPDPQEIRQMLHTLRHQCRWPEKYLALVLGTPRWTLAAWMSGYREPSGAARKWIWCLYHILLNTGVVQNHRDIATWAGGLGGKGVKIRGNDFKIAIPEESKPLVWGDGIDDEEEEDSTERPDLTDLAIPGTQPEC